MNTEPMLIQVSIVKGELDDTEFTAQLIEQLAEELQQIDAVIDVEPCRTELPGGAKGTPVDFGAILITIAEGSGITTLVTSLIGWVSRDRSRTLKLTLNDNSIELTGLSAKDQATLIKWFKIHASAKPA